MMDDIKLYIPPSKVNLNNFGYYSNLEFLYFGGSTTSTTIKSLPKGSKVDIQYRSLLLPQVYFQVLRAKWGISIGDFLEGIFVVRTMGDGQINKIELYKFKSNYEYPFAISDYFPTITEIYYNFNLDSPFKTMRI